MHLAATLGLPDAALGRLRRVWGRLPREGGSANSTQDCRRALQELWWPGFRDCYEALILCVRVWVVML